MATCDTLATTSVSPPPPNRSRPCVPPRRLNPSAASSTANEACCGVWYEAREQQVVDKRTVERGELERGARWSCRVCCRHRQPVLARASPPTIDTGGGVPDPERSVLCSVA